VSAAFDPTGPGSVYSKGIIAGALRGDDKINGIVLLQDSIQLSKADRMRCIKCKSLLRREAQKFFGMGHVRESAAPTLNIPGLNHSEQ